MLFKWLCCVEFTYFVIIKITIMSIQVGQKAPDFVLYDTDKNKVSLSDQKEKM